VGPLPLAGCFLLSYSVGIDEDMTPSDTTIDYKLSSFLYIDFSALFLIDSLLVKQGNKFLLKKLFEIPFDDTQVSKIPL